MAPAQLHGGPTHPHGIRKGCHYHDTASWADAWCRGLYTLCAARLSYFPPALSQPRCFLILIPNPPDSALYLGGQVFTRSATRCGFYGSCSGLQRDTRPQGTLERSKNEPSGDQRMAMAPDEGAAYLVCISNEASLCPFV